jgi:hypothetical protein
MIPLLRDAGPTKLTSCALVASTDLEKALDAVKEVIEGASAPSAMMGNRPAKSPSQLATVGGRLTPSTWVTCHLRARVPLLPRAMVRVLFMHFPLVRQSRKSIIQSLPHILLWVSSPQRRRMLAVLKPNRIIRTRTDDNCSSFHLRVFLGLSNPQGQGQTISISIPRDNFGEKKLSLI